MIKKGRKGNQPKGKEGKEIQRKRKGKRRKIGGKRKERGNKGNKEV